MIKIFKHNEVLQIIIIVLTVVLLWAPALLNPPVMQTGHDYAPIYSLVYSALVSHPLLATILAMVLTIVEGFTLNLVLFNRKMLGNSTLLPTLLYIIAMSMVPAQMTLTPMILSNLILLLALNQLMVDDDLSATPDNIFNASMLISIATLCHTPLIMMLVALVVIFTIHGLFNWRYWMMLLLGFLAPYIISATAYYLTDRLYYVSYITRLNITDIHFSIAQVQWPIWVCNSIFIIILLWFLLSARGIAVERTQMYRKNNGVIASYVLGGVLALLYSHLLPANPEMFAIPMAFIGTVTLFGAKKKLWIHNLLFVFFIILAIAANWWRL